MYPWREDDNLNEVLKIIDLTNNIQPPIAALEWARDRLILWEVKVNQFQYLPELEATLSLVSAILKDRKVNEKIEKGQSLTNECYDICTFYAMSVVKFCNLLPYYEMTKKKRVIRAGKASKKSVRDLGLELDLPSWVLECRHNTCHASTNSLILLRQANYFALQWIFKNFWEKMIKEEEELRTANQMFKFERKIKKMTKVSEGKKKLLVEKLKSTINENRDETFKIIVDFLVEDSSNKLGESDMDLGELPVALVKPYAKLLQVMDNFEFIESFFYHLTNHFTNQEEKKARIAVLWLKTVATCIGGQDNQNSVSRTLNIPFEVDPEIEDILWQKVLYNATKTPTKFTIELIVHLSNLIPPTCIDPDYLKQLKDLANAFINYSVTKKMLSQSEKTTSYTVKTVDDLHDEIRITDQTMEVC